MHWLDGKLLIPYRDGCITQNSLLIMCPSVAVVTSCYECSRQLKDSELPSCVLLCCAMTGCCTVLCLTAVLCCAMLCYAVLTCHLVAAPGHPYLVQ